MAVATFSVDADPSQCTSTVPVSVDDAEMCLMTPPRHPMIDTLQWTPTANLKLLLKAASPDLHSREMWHSRSSVNEVFQSKPVTDDTITNDCEADTTTADKCVENVAVSMDKRRRKEKSLGLLCERFLEKFPLSPNFQQQEVILNEVAASLSVCRRRVYDIINVLEAINFATRLAKNKYAWHGNLHLSDTVTSLFRLAQLEGISEQIEQARISEDGCESENDSSSSSKALVADAEKMSLSHLTQKFFMLFLVAPQCTLSLDLSAKVLLADSATDQHDVSKLKTTVRRLYDIANILISLQLVQKLSGVELKSRKALFMYVGPQSNDMTATVPRKQPFARHLSFDQICEVATIEREKLSSVEGKSNISSLWPHHSDKAVKSDVSTERLPMAVELENSVSVRMVQSAPQRHLSCFLRTKSDGAINSSSSSISSPLSSAVDATNKPLAVTLHALSGYLQSQNRMKTGQAVHDIKLKKRTYQPEQSNSRWWPISTQGTVVAKSECCEYAPSVDSVEFQQKVPKSSKSDDHKSCQKLPAHLLSYSSDQSGSSFQPASAICWNGRSTDISIANAVTVQKVSTVGKLNVNMSDIRCCTAVPLSTSNIVNVSHPCPLAGQNTNAVRRRVILIKRRQDVPLT